MIKSITNFLIIFFIFQQLKSQISQIDQNGYNAFCDETLHMFILSIFVERAGPLLTPPVRFSTDVFPAQVVLIIGRSRMESVWVGLLPYKWFYIQSVAL